MRIFLRALLFWMCSSFSFLNLAGAQGADLAEIYCSIRESGVGLNCQWVNKDSVKPMNPEDISLFIDKGASGAYITIKSRKGTERTFLVDPKSAQYRKLNEMKGASISEINKYKNEMFTEMEKKVIKASDDLDAQFALTDLIKIDPTIALGKARREMRGASSELEGFRKNRDKVCTSTPAFEQLSKANASLQQTLSNIIYAFQTPDTCMRDFKTFKDKDGAVDLRQLGDLGQHYKEKCKIK